ncbi:protein-methionine-sulfoxide reductase heme-binding subunit MsrQ [Ascidiaceihabitans sp.]|uniref:protein-methionine-sulfoxide reductase heme-binding subunit MsrQ n=1 Tax=Ascidiaceihabitans sp. TaxID=1872644 RepID=UPI00329A3BAB
MIDTLNTIFRKIPVWLVWVLYLIPVPVLLYMGMTGGLGREPIKALEHELGEIALQLLIIGLCLTPLRRFIGLNLLKFRRAIGLLAFTYVALHLLVWLVLDVQILSQIWQDILKRPYITIGMVGFLVMVPLAVTSNNRSVRTLGPKWRTLHKATYLAAVLGGAHFLMVSRGIQLEPLLYMATILALIGLRFYKPRKRPAA